MPEKVEDPQKAVLACFLSPNTLDSMVLQVYVNIFPVIRPISTSHNISSSDLISNLALAREQRGNRCNFLWESDESCRSMVAVSGCEKASLNSHVFLMGFWFFHHMLVLTSSSSSLSAAVETFAHSSVTDRIKKSLELSLFSCWNSTSSLVSLHSFIVR